VLILTVTIIEKKSPENCGKRGKYATLLTKSVKRLIISSTYEKDIRIT